MASEFCPQCGNPRTGSFRFCRSCGFDYDTLVAAPTPQPVSIGAPAQSQWQTPSAPSVPVPSRGYLTLRNLLGLIAAVMLIAFVLNNGWSIRTGGPTARLPAAPWTPPAGFEVTTLDDNVAFRWVDDPSGCIMGRCWGMEVISRDGCPTTLYIELTTLTPSGTVVGYTNDIVSGLRAGEKAQMTFENTDESATKARLSKVTCF